MRYLPQFKRGFFVALFLAFFLGGTTSNAQDWIWQNPSPQGNSLYGVKAFSPSSAVMVGAAGTILRTTNAGSSWNSQFRVDSISGILRSCYFIDNNIGWAVGDTGAILLTTTGGISWEKNSYLSIKKNLRAVHFVSTYTGWVVGDSGTICLTTNSGLSWSSQESPVENNLRAINMLNTQEGWVVGQNGTILKTSNGGATWDSVYLGNSVDYFAVTFMNSDTGWIAGNSGTLLKTTNKGETWKRLNSNTTSPIYSLKRVAPNFIYASGFRVFLSGRDTSSTWRAASVNSQSVYYDLSFSDPSSGWIVGSGGEMQQTVDSGKTWTAKQSGSSSDFSAISILDTSNVFIGGLNGIMIRSTNGGRTFSSVQPDSSDFTINSIQFVSRFGLAVGDSGTILVSQDKGASWNSRNSETKNSLRCISMVDSTTAWIGGDRILLFTTNSGTTWSHVDPPDSTSVIGDMKFTTRNKGVVLAFKVELYKTLLLRTTNGGSTWSYDANLSSGATNSMYFLDSLNGWAVGNGNTMLETIDGGITWLPAVLPIGRSYSCVFFASTSTGWIGASDGLILKTTNGGAKWAMLYTNTSSTVSEISFFNGSTGWAVGSRGMIIKSTNGGGDGLPIGRYYPPPVRREVNPVLTNFPNPFSDSTWIPFDLTANSNVTVRIYDLNGRFVRELNAGTLSAGQYRTKGFAILWDGRDMNNVRLATGVYFYQIITNYSIIAHKMLLLR